MNNDSLLISIRIALGGLAIWTMGYLLVKALGQPARRLRAGVFTLAASLLLIPLSFAPSWIALPWSNPWPEKNSTSTTVVEKSTTEAAPSSVMVVYTLPTRRASTVAVEPIPREQLSETIAPVLYFHWTSLIPYGIFLLSGISVVLFARLLRGTWVLRHLWQESQELSYPIKGLWKEIQTDVRISGSCRMLDPLPTAMCFGMFRPRVLIPEIMTRSNGFTALRWVLTHEANHLKRKDPLVNWLLELAGVFYFWCPTYWLLRRDMRRNQEYLADAAVAREQANTAEYAQFLIDSLGVASLPRGAAAVFPKRSELFRRVHMLIHRQENLESQPPRKWNFLTGATILASAVLVAGLGLKSQTAIAQDNKPKTEETKKSPEDELAEKQKKLKAELEKLDAERKGQNAGNVPAAPAVPVPPQIPAMPALPNFQLRVIPLEGLDNMKELQEAMKQMEALQLQLGNGQLQGFQFGNPMMLNGMNAKPRLGVRVSTPPAELIEQLELPPNQGVLVKEVVPGTPAEKAGLKPNDVLMEIGGKKVPPTSEELPKFLEGFKANENLDVKVIRKGKPEKLSGLKLPEVAKADAKMVFPQMNGLQLNGFPGGLGNFNSTSVSIVNGDFTIESRNNEESITVKGHMEGGKKDVSSVTVKAGDKSTSYDSLDKVPAQQKERVNKLLEGVR